MEPLRVAEVTSPLGKAQVTIRLTHNTDLKKNSGEHCGSQYINENLYAMVYELLETETYLTAKGESLGDIINSSVIHRFETEIKPTFRSEDEEPWVFFHVEGLRANPDKNFLNSTLRIRRFASFLYTALLWF